MTTKRNTECSICAGPLPRGRIKYCSEDCNQVGVKRGDHARAAKRMQSCRTCGKPKERGVRGSRYCSVCREAAADATAARDRERNRFRSAERRAAERLARPKKAETPPGTKWCSLCAEFRPLQAFTARIGSKPGSYCRPCAGSYNHERRLRTAFGMSLGEYEALMRAQDDRCAICRKLARKMRLAVDHNHKTGEIRGLLCGRCNRKLLGAADESSDRLRIAADYLDNPPARRVLTFGSEDGRVVPVTRIITREVAAYLAANGFPHAEPAPGDRVDGVPGVAIRVREDVLGLSDDEAPKWLIEEPGLMVVRRHRRSVAEWWCWLRLGDLHEFLGVAGVVEGQDANAAACMELRSLMPLLVTGGYARSPR